MTVRIRTFCYVGSARWSSRDKRSAAAAVGPLGLVEATSPDTGTAHLQQEWYSGTANLQ
jgi:hypothetical protein